MDTAFGYRKTHLQKSLKINFFRIPPFEVPATFGEIFRGTSEVALRQLHTIACHAYRMKVMEKPNRQARKTGASWGM